MIQREAEVILAREIKSGSPVGQALSVFLTGFELELYRQSHSVADPFLTGKIAGRGEGVNLALKRLNQHQTEEVPNRPPQQ